MTTVTLAPVTLRLDAATRRRLALIARRRGLTASAAIREAIRRFVEADAEQPGWSAYDRMRDLVGCVALDRGRSARRGRR
jgi:hypothetical protein